MAFVNSKVKIYSPRVKAINAAAIRALEKTGEALRTEVVQAQVMPRDTGELQDKATFVEYGKSKEGVVSLISQTPYARRLYYHPEYNFRRTENPNAQGKWLEPWISGDKKNWCRNAFVAFLKQEGGA